ncbi:MAG: UDP-N-acetylmuramoylalanyl-D-glutamate--2,6-diaminopimelate ligase [Anaerolinea sp.]|nr:UDP-N-acetylmuramoylalanyl-D-glutamate--2,6-diaminopimelate ligase [Anaerolinea sp.]
MSEHLTTGFAARVMRQHGYLVMEGPEAAITGGAADSRAVQPGDLFTAFPGENVDGNRFVADALHNGAVAVICERVPDGDFPGKTIVVAPDTTRAVGELANAWRRECNPRVAGITGTVGKTTTKDLTAAAVAAGFSTHKSAGNFNSREGLPLALMSLRRDHQVSVLEMAMDSLGEILYLCEIAEPEIGVVMNVGLTHIEKLGSIEAIQREKLTLARYLPTSGTAVLNIDDPRIAPVASELRCNVITFGASDAATLRCEHMDNRGLLGVSFDVSFGGESARVDSPLPGEHTVPAALAAIGVCLALGMDLGQAAAAVSGSVESGRARIVTGHAGATIIDDRYNSSPDSLAGALRMLGALPGRRIAFLGRMAELGDFELQQHLAAGEIAAENVDILVAVGETCRALAESATAAGLADVRWFATKEEAAAEVRATLLEGDTVLLKASRGEAFETILPMLGASA